MRTQQQQINNKRNANAIAQDISRRTSELLDTIRQDIRRSDKSPEAMTASKDKLIQGIQDILQESIKETLGHNIPSLKLLHMLATNMGAVKGAVMNEHPSIEPTKIDNWLIAAKKCDEYFNGQLQETIDATITSLYESEEKYTQSKNLYDQEFSPLATTLGSTAIISAGGSLTGVMMVATALICTFIGMTPVGVITGLIIAGSALTTSSLLVGGLAFASMCMLEPEAAEREIQKAAKEFGFEPRSTVAIIEDFAGTAMDKHANNIALTALIRSNIKIPSTVAEKLDKLNGMPEALEKAAESQVSVGR